MALLELIGLLLLTLACLGLMVYAVGLFNDLVRLRRTAERDFANVEVVLKQRHDEIPRLVEIVRGYARHERELLERVTALRGSYERAGDTAARVRAENALAAALAAVPAVVERYPALRADREFQRLARRLSEVESVIADRRELYNQATTWYNTAVDRFPQLLFARLFRFRRGELLEFPEARQAEAPPLRMTEAGV